MKVINRSIDVITWTKDDGSIYPFKFRITEDSDERHTYNIDKILTIDEDKILGKPIYKYTCLIQMSNIQKICEIRYHKDTMKWSLFKV
ncbi:hypothetical protein [Vallitalea okinawensis]|uniref:hypothetical protein n=1 Tax=Vallitalea okinawensis TaxID=2078660 RepID=UPI000CFD335E|nr:hypothetical protein [Vallitalea okinawensis]